MQTIEEQIAAINPEALEWLNTQLGEFMQPSASLFDADDIRSLDHEDSNEDSGLTDPGWYARLSAPGYLDCTDWQGPYESEAHALVALWEVYGD